MNQSFRLILNSLYQIQIRSIQTTSSLFLPSKLPKIQKLNESDLIEEFVRGSGPGGQCINKLSISVSLIHKPTGIRVQCHAQRSRESNRKEARKILSEKVDLFLNPGKSKLEFKWQKARDKKRAKIRQRKRRENEDDGDGDETSSKPSIKEEKTDTIKES